MTRTHNRPVFLDLRRIHQPTTALVSLGHRITGLLLFALLPFGLYLLDLSLRSAEGFARAGELAAAWPVRLLALLALWWFAHHLFAGLRLLLLDLDIGSGLPAARRSARWVFGGELAALLLAAVWLL